MRTAASDTFAVREWLAADADARTPTDRIAARMASTCDEIGCVARLRDGAIVALPFAAEAFEEDCRRAALVVSQRTAPPSCAATADRPHGLAAHGRDGALSDRKRVGEGGRVSGRLRPAVGARRAQREARATASASTPAPRDATPRTEDLERRRLRCRSILPEQPDQLALDAHAVGRQDAHLVGRCWRARARSRRRGGGSASASLPRRRSAPPRCRRCRRVSPLRISTVSPSRMPASIIESPRTSSAKCSPVVSRSGGTWMVWLRVWIASIGVPAAMRPMTGMVTGRPPSSSEPARTRPRSPSMTRRREAAPAADPCARPARAA